MDRQRPVARCSRSILGTNLGQPDIPLLLLYAGSMYVTQKMTVTPLDPQQAEQQRMMAIMTPFMTTYFFLQYHLPSAFVLYYLIFNILSTAQQKYYMKKRARDGHCAGNGGDGGSKTVVPLPTDGAGGGSAKAASRRTATATAPRPPPPGPGAPCRSPRRRTRRRPSAGTSSPGQPSNGATPTARGVIAPAKVHPKKKRR